MKFVVGDNLDNLTWVVKKACQRAQLVVISGGLGPTEDDITREAVCTALKRKLAFNEEIVAGIRALFQRRGLAMPEINTRQAFVIEGSEILVNRVGTAPGQYLDQGNCKVLLLPGPPNELIPMFDEVFQRCIAPLSNFHIVTRVFKLAGITESETDAMVADIYTRYRNPLTTILASPGVIEIHLLGRSRDSLDEARQVTDELAGKIRDKIKDFLFAESDVSLEEIIVHGLRHQGGLTLAVAESCSGGGLANLITNVPGSSDVFRGGVIAYANELKTKLLGVGEESLRRYGAVSETVAREMAEGVRRVCGSAIGLAVTGIAGPGGGSDQKPVGLVYIHLHAENFDRGVHQIFSGNREIVKRRSAYYALNVVREYLKKLGGD